MPKIDASNRPAWGDDWSRSDFSRLAIQAMETAVDTVYWIRPDGRFCYVNPAACSSLGYSRDELLKVPVWNVIPDWPANTWGSIWQQLRTARLKVLEAHHQTCGGRVFPVEIRTSLLLDSGRELCCSFARDITRRRRERTNAAAATVRQLVLSEPRLDSLMQKVAETTADTLDVDCCGILRQQPCQQQLLLQTGVGWQADCVGHRAIPCTTVTLASAQPIVFQHYGDQSDPSTLPELWREHEFASSGLMPIRPGGEPYGAIGVHTRRRRPFSPDDLEFLTLTAKLLADAIERNSSTTRLEETVLKLKIATEELTLHREELRAQNAELVAARAQAESERARFKELFEFAPDAYVITDLQGVIRDVNQVACRLFNRSQDELISSPLITFVTTKDNVVFLDLLKRCRQHADSTSHAELQLQRHGEAPIHAAVSVVSKRPATHRSRGFRWLIRDITARKKIEEELLDSRRRLQALFDHSLEAILLADDEARLVDSNSTAHRLLAGDRLDFSRLTLFDLVPAADRVSMRLTWTRFLDEGRFIGEFVAQGRDGRSLTLEYSAIANVLPELHLWMLRDVTQRKMVEKQLRQQQQQLEHVNRRGIMSEMASALAHELNQPIGAIANYSGPCAEGLRDGRLELSEALHVFEHIEEQALRAGEITRHLKRFVAKTVPQRRSLDLNEVVLQVERLIHNAASMQHVEIVLDLAEKLPLVLADPIQIQQVLVNLVQNGLEAMQENGREDRRLVLRTSRTDAKVQLSAIDRGKELDNDELQHIFDPYFTTKPDGLGLGLSISKSIVTAHGGRLFAQRNPDKGITLTFDLPIDATLA